METLPSDRVGDDLIRVVLTGSESTGKTTLAAELARHYGAALVPEFVRSFAEQKGGALRFIDHGPIARGQMAIEDEHIAAARGLRRLVVFDTDLLSTAIYCNHYFGRCPLWIEQTARTRRPDLYLLCETDVPWIPDGVRDRGDRRDEMQTLFRDAVIASGAPYVAVKGDVTERLARSIRAIDALLDARR
jgi:NadR type nicotinamide-nucleotide adenylyltransferase